MEKWCLTKVKLDVYQSREGEAIMEMRHADVHDLVASNFPEDHYGCDTDLLGHTVCCKEVYL